MLNVAEHRISLGREQSKRLLGGLYRAEVAHAIGSLRVRSWTKSDLVEKLRGVPPSCVNKELTLFREAGLIERVGREGAGEYMYVTHAFDDYWKAAALIAVGDVPPGRGADAEARAVITRGLVDRSSDAPLGPTRDAPSERLP